MSTQNSSWKKAAEKAQPGLWVSIDFAKTSVHRIDFAKKATFLAAALRDGGAQRKDPVSQLGSHLEFFWESQLRTQKVEAILNTYEMDYPGVVIQGKGIPFCVC